MNNLPTYVSIALNSRKINNNNMSSNQMYHNLQIRSKTTDSNATRQYITHNATQIMEHNMNIMEQYQLPFQNKIRPNEETNQLCDPDKCIVQEYDPSGYGQGRGLCNH